MSENQTQAPPPVQPPPPTQFIQTPGSPESQARTWNMLCHLSALAGFVGVPFGNILGPLIVWQLKKNEFPSVDIHGKAAVNFQLTAIIGILISSVAGLLLLAIGVGALLFLVGGVIALCSLIFAIVAGIKANNGEDYKYPYSLGLVK